ncbi:MAG: T9SS type B sorting domain-containing protein, partial [Flavobacteriales bacterium]|nr:T9SS type B sorting domain-containing protein [Flavobacteriales bacterium]
VNPADYVIEPNKPFCITIESNDTNFEDTLFLFVDSEVLDTAFFPAASFTPVTGTGIVSSQFSWTPDCSSLRTEPYEIEISSFSTGCTDSTFTSQDTFSILVELPPDEPTEMVLPLSTDLSYVMNGDEHCFFVQLNDVDCYDTLRIYADTTGYSFSQAGIRSTFTPSPAALFNVSGEYCWRPQCPDITFDLTQPHQLDFYVDSRKCDVVNTYKYPFLVNIIPETDGQIQLPNIFTPNEDALNVDFTTFKDTDFCIRQFDMKLYNRWGNVVYSATDKDFKWDGIHQDTEQEVAPGVYYYIINYDVFDKQYTYTGDVTLVR